jgi:hypothetical protein
MLTIVVVLCLEVVTIAIIGIVVARTTGIIIMMPSTKAVSTSLFCETN